MGQSNDATTDQLTKITNPLDDDTTFTYGTHDSLIKVTHPDLNDWHLTSLQTKGLPTGSSGNSLTSADPEGSMTDERSKIWKFRTDRFGNATQSTNPLSDKTLIERNADGQAIKLTEADPDGAGSQTSPVTILGYDETGNLVYQKNPDATTKTWTYTTTFNFVDTATDELGRDVSYDHDVDGNVTEFTDGEGYETTYTYNSNGFVTKITTPDPDDSTSTQGRHSTLPGALRPHASPI